MVTDFSESFNQSGTISAQRPPAAPQSGEELDAIRTITQKLRQKLSEASHNLVESGELLLRAKKLLGHGNFQPWLRENFSMSIKTANRFMSVAKMVQRLELKNDTVADLLSLDLNTLYEIAAKSTPESVQRQVFAEMERKNPISYELVRMMKKQEPLQPVMDEFEFRQFTRMLKQFSNWFEHHQPQLQAPLKEMQDDMRIQLESYAQKLKAASNLVEDMLSQASAITIDVPSQALDAPLDDDLAQPAQYSTRESRIADKLDGVEN